MDLFENASKKIIHVVCKHNKQNQNTLNEWVAFLSQIFPDNNQLWHHLIWSIITSCSRWDSNQCFVHRIPYFSFNSLSMWLFQLDRALNDFFFFFSGMLQKRWKTNQFCPNFNTMCIHSFRKNEEKIVLSSVVRCIHSNFVLTME